MEIHERIKSLREAKGLNQSDMATYLKIATQNYWKIEKGKTELTVSRLYQIADVLGVSATELMTGEPQKVEDTGKVEALENRIKELNEIVEILRNDRNRLSDYFSNLLQETINEFLEEEFFWNSRALYSEEYRSEIEKMVDSVIMTQNITNKLIVKASPITAIIYLFLIFETTEFINDQESAEKIYTVGMKKTSEAMLEYAKRNLSKSQIFQIEYFAKHLTIEQENLLELKRVLFKDVDRMYEINLELIIKQENWKYAYPFISESLQSEKDSYHLMIMRFILTSGVLRNNEINDLIK